jgi:hypothetical protein
MVSEEVLNTLTKRKAPHAPATLQAHGPGRELWRRVLSEWLLRPDETRMLEDACQESDLIQRMRAEIAGEPLTLLGPRGAVIAHPLLDEIRRHEALLARLLTGLGLREGDAMGASMAGRALVSKRWKH